MIPADLTYGREAVVEDHQKKLKRKKKKKRDFSDLAWR